MLLYGVRDSSLEGDPLGNVVELFLRHEEAEALVDNCDRDEPEQAGLRDVVEVEFPVAPN